MSFTGTQTERRTAGRSTGPCSTRPAPTHTLSLDPVIYGMSVRPPSVQLKPSAGFVRPQFIMSLMGAIEANAVLCFSIWPFLRGHESLPWREMPPNFILQIYWKHRARQFNLWRLKLKAESRLFIIRPCMSSFPERQSSLFFPRHSQTVKSNPLPAKSIHIQVFNTYCDR